MDQRLREFERKWLASGADEDEQPLLSARVQGGDLSEATLRLAAYCGHAPARALVGDDVGPATLTSEWIEGLAAWDRTAAVCVALGAARAAYPKKRLGHPEPTKLIAPFAVAEAWLRSRCPLREDRARSKFDGLRLPGIFPGEGSRYMVDGWVGRDAPGDCIPPGVTDFPHGGCVLIEGDARLEAAARQVAFVGRRDADRCWELALGRRQWKRGPVLSSTRKRKENAILGFNLRAVAAACEAAISESPLEPCRLACIAGAWAVDRLKRTSVEEALEEFREYPKLLGGTASLLEAVRLEVATWLLGYGEAYRVKLSEELRESLDAKDPCACMPKPGTPEGKKRGITWAAYYKRKKCPVHRR